MSKKTTVFPFKKQILIKANTQDTKTAGGIIIDGTSSVSDSRSATVVRIGPDVTAVKEGYTVFVNWAKSLPVKIDGLEYSFIDEENLVALVDKE